jgi:hypothetical protein
MNRKELEAVVDAIQGQLDLVRSDFGDRVSDKEVISLAERFCQMDDDAQAQFFCKVAAIMDRWPTGPGLSHGRSGQCYYIGRHLATCTCSTEAGRELVREIAGAMGYDDRTRLEDLLSAEKARTLELQQKVVRGRRRTTLEEEPMIARHRKHGWTVVLRSKADNHAFLAWGVDIPFVHVAFFRTREEARVLWRNLKGAGMFGQIRRATLEVKS